MRGSPVESRDAVPGNNIRQLYAAEDDRKEEREKYGEIPIGRNTQLQVTPANERTQYSKKPLIKDMSTTSGKYWQTMHT